jgi:hypothetical protein
MAIDQLYPIFHPIDVAKAADLDRGDFKFVHYTSADAAAKMLKNHEVWLRQSSTMNDFSEIEHGNSCLHHAWHSEIGNRFRRFLDRLYPGLSDDLSNGLDQVLPELRLMTYLASLSEHPPEEDRLGRLSMWRAYGNVAIVLNPAAIRSQSAALGIYSSAVAYLTKEEFLARFREIVERAENSEQQLRAAGRESVDGRIFTMLQYAILCTKHPAFLEEREWRAIYRPVQIPSPKVKVEVEVIRNVAQPVCKLDLRDRPDLGLVGLDIDKLVDRIIVGPTQYPAVMTQAFIELLRAAKVPNAHERVWMSNIPLRQD